MVRLRRAAATRCPFWLTFKQAQALGGNVRKGEHGELVVYADRITRTETDDKGEEIEREIPFLKGYTVFNAEQCENLPAHFTAKAEAPALPLSQRIETADRFFAKSEAARNLIGTRHRQRTCVPCFGFCSGAARRHAIW